MDTNTLFFVFAAIQAIGVVLAFFRVDIRILRRIRGNGPAMTTPREKVMAALAFGALVLSGIGFYRAMSSPLKPNSPIARETLERDLRVFFDGVGFGVRTVSSPDSIFRLEITTPISHRSFIVAQPKVPGNIVAFRATIVISQGHQDKLKASPEKAELLVRQLRIEMARVGISWQGLNIPLTRLILQREIPIADNLSEATIMESMKRIEDATILAAETVALTLE